MNGYWFTSARFVANSADGTSQMAAWLAMQLEQRGYSVEPAVEEDWGCCLMLSRKPFLLWVGCGSVDASAADRPYNGKTTWHCFPTAEISLTRRLFGKPETATAVAKLHSDLHAILAADPQIALTAEPLA